MNGRAPWRQRDFSFLEEQYSEYESIFGHYTGRTLAGHAAMEIGVGQRPYRLLNLYAHGVNVRGLDLDVVVLEPSAQRFMKCFYKNGLERGLKTTARSLIIDSFENQSLLRKLRDWQPDMVLPDDRISLGDAANAKSCPNQKFDFIYSEDVFEHIPQAKLPSVCENVQRHLAKDGIVIVRPMVFTGIQGGHHVDWYDATSDKLRKCPAWDHLREQKYLVNTYLNEMTLADYRVLFSRHFRVLEEKTMEPERGRKFLTNEVRKEFDRYSEEELLSNHVLFVLAHST